MKVDITNNVLLYRFEREALGKIFYVNLYKGCIGDKESLYYTMNTKQTNVIDDIVLHSVIKLQSIDELVLLCCGYVANELRSYADNLIYSDDNMLLYYYDDVILKSIENNNYHFKHITNDRTCRDIENISLPFKNSPILDIIINGARILVFNLKKTMRII